MKMKKIIILVFLLFSISPLSYCLSPSLSTRTHLHTPQKDSLDLITFKPQLAAFPFSINYPAKWYVLEEILETGLECKQSFFLLLTPDKPNLPKTAPDKVGITIYFSKNDSNLGPLDPKVQEKVNKGDLHMLESLGYQIKNNYDTELFEYPAKRIEYQDSHSCFVKYKITAKGVYMTVEFQAPQSEYNDYKKIFDAILNSFQILN